MIFIKPNIVNSDKAIYYQFNFIGIPGIPESNEFFVVDLSYLKMHQTALKSNIFFQNEGSSGLVLQLGISVGNIYLAQC